jgi:hypothetical protein
VILPLRFILTLLLVAASAGVLAIDWPIAPQDQSQPIGNDYGEYQNYSGFAYYHPGIDILAPAGTPVYAIKSGYVKAILTISAELHWRIAIGDSAGADECDGWLYAHLDEGTLAVTEGEWVEEGRYLGDLVAWPIASFHHLHFVKIRNSGLTWNSDWQFIANPLDELDSIDDDLPPNFMDAYGTQLFAFCQNESESYFFAGETLSGEVDIICRADDLINHLWQVAPYRLEYKIEGDSSIPWTNSVCFTGPLGWDTDVNIVYQNDSYCISRGDYDNRIFYFNLTNTDGDSIIEVEDRQQSWQTAAFHNGQYTVYVRAHDRAGNTSSDSMVVDVENYFSLTGTIRLDDASPELDGTIITVFPDARADTTDTAAAFSMAMIGGGSQRVTMARPGYETIDTILTMNRHHHLEIVMEPGYYIVGDANYDDLVNIGDAVHIINYTFRGGHAPQPYASGDVNSDDLVNIGDAVFLINYIFLEGPPPTEDKLPVLTSLLELN